MNASALASLLERLPPLATVLELARARYAELSDVRGTIRLDADQARAVQMVGGKVPSSGRLALREFDRALRDSSIGAGLLDVLREHGELPTTREQADALAREQWVGFRNRMVQAAGVAGIRVEQWIDADMAYLYGKVVRGRPRLLRGALQAATALADLPLEREEPLAYYAARRFGDAHTLDPDQPAGRLLLRAVRTLVYPVIDAEADRALSPRARTERALASAGLLLDDLSSDVLCAGIRLDMPWTSEAARAYEPLRLTLHTLNRATAVMPLRGRTIYAVENPPVFRILYEQARAAGTPVPLVCTSGHPSLAAQRMIQLLAQAGCRVRYSGDFDARGYAVALWFRQRHPSEVELWRMDKEEVETARHRAPAGPPPAPGRLPAEFEALLAGGTAHQETIADLLWLDVEVDVRAGGAGPRQPLPVDAR